MTNEVILMSHGLMAKEILNSAQMILGDQINYPVVSMTPDDGIEGTSRIQVITGVNLGMVLESFFAIKEENLVEHLLKIGTESIKIPKLQIAEEEEE